MCSVQISSYDHLNVCIRMDLCFETKSALADSLLATKLELADERNYIYRLPGCKAFGICTFTIYILF